MRVFQFTEQPYPDVWNDHNGSLRVNLPNRKLDPKRAADLFHRYYDEWQLTDELGLDIMLNEHHSTATCMSAAVVVGLSVLSRITKRARLLVLGYPIANRPDPLRAAEELATIDVISRGRLEMGFVRGVPQEVPIANMNPVFQSDRFWEAHDFIMKALTSHDEPFNWESENFHYRHVNIWPRPYQQPHPPVWSTTGSTQTAKKLGTYGYVMATLGTGYDTRRLYDAYRQGYAQKIRCGGTRRPVCLSWFGCSRAQRGGSAAAGRADCLVSAHFFHRVRAVPQSARLSVGRRQCPYTEG
jgi:alkanesulfonate monooxygenase SsuD/methylene tetrahydromethanopterin reductase-like flavin-dependent oxidoreductase (luciferase family)